MINQTNNLFIILLFLTASVVFAQENDLIRSYDKQAIKVTRDAFFQMDVNIYKDKIVWVDFRHNVKDEWRRSLVLHQPCITDLYLFNIKTSETKRITETKTWKQLPQLSDNYVLWSERKTQEDFENERTIVKNLNTGTETILEKGWGHKLLPNDKILFLNNGIFVTDLNKDTTIKLKGQEPGNYNSMRYPDMSGDYLIWLQEYWTKGKTGTNVHIYNIPTKVEKIVSKYEGQGSLPHICGDTVVLARASKANAYEICLHKLTDMKLADVKLTTIATSQNQLTCPYIDGSFLTYVNVQNFTYNIYNHETNKTLSIKATTSLHPFRGLKISVKKVVWIDDGDVYYLNLSDKRK